MASAPIERVPAKSWCSPLEPKGMAGATTAPGSSAAAACAKAIATCVSVPIGRCGPCCSVAPSGTISVVGPLAARSSISGHVARSSRAALIAA